MALVRYQPPAIAVARRWQFAHSTRHFAISAAMIAVLQPCLTIALMSSTFSRWSLAVRLVVPGIVLCEALAAPRLELGLTSAHWWERFDGLGQPASTARLHSPQRTHS